VVNFNTLAEQILLSQGAVLPQEAGDPAVSTTTKSWFTGEVTVTSSEDLYAAVEAVTLFGNTNVIRSFGVANPEDTPAECVYVDSREWIAFDFIEPASDIRFTVTGAQTGDAKDVFREYSYGAGLHGAYDLEDYFGEGTRFSRVVIMSPSSNGAAPFRGIRLGELSYTTAPARPPAEANDGFRWNPWAKRTKRR
jgi:hypothetical protein